MPRRVLQGKIVSDINDKTVVVEVQRYFFHPLYKKRVLRTKKYHAHDEKNQYKSGQFVMIQECKPISAKKTWSVLKEKQS